jgi:response regulator of citrate/malate metabolism
MTYRVLVVEDELVAGEANAAYATRVGLDVVGVARSGREALRLLADARDVDLLLLDMQLPDGHGLELLRRIRAGGAEVDVIAVTAARDVEVVRSAVAQGVVSYLIKPFTFPAFRTKIEDYRHYREQLVEQAGQVSQLEVDAMIATLRPTASSDALPKGLASTTAALAIRLVRDHQALSAAELGYKLGTSRVTARRYLEYLADSGLVGRGPRHGGSGRPEVEYRWR